MGTLDELALHDAAVVLTLLAHLDCAVFEVVKNRTVADVLVAANRRVCQSQTRCPHHAIRRNLQDPSLLPQPEMKNLQTGRCAADDSRIEELLKHAEEAKNLFVKLRETRGVPGGLHRVVCGVPLGRWH